MISDFLCLPPEHWPTSPALVTFWSTTRKILNTKSIQLANKPITRLTFTSRQKQTNKQKRQNIYYHATSSLSTPFTGGLVSPVKRKNSKDARQRSWYQTSRTQVMEHLKWWRRIPFNVRSTSHNKNTIKHINSYKHICN